MRDDVGAMSRRIRELEEEMENSTLHTTLNEEEAFRDVDGMTTWENPDDQTARWAAHHEELRDMAIQRPRFHAHKKRIEAAIEITSGEGDQRNHFTFHQGSAQRSEKTRQGDWKSRHQRIPMFLLRTNASTRKQPQEVHWMYGCRSSTNRMGQILQQGVPREALGRSRIRT
jgi:hypothetical protein